MIIILDNQDFSAHCMNSQRGVSILADKSFPLTYHAKTPDSKGLYIVLTASIYYKKFTIANIYGYNNLQQ